MTSRDALDPGGEPDRVTALDAHWRAANYLAVGQIYLLENPLLREPLRREHVKPRLLGHWGTTPGLNFVYTHLNRVIRARDLSMIFICGPGHGGPAMVACTYLEGTYSELYPEVSRDVAGLRRLFRQFSFPGGIPSHAAPETPGSIHEGGELGYSLAHAYGAVLDNPELIAACVIGDGEAETGPLAAAWHSNKFLHPATDGAVLPILHLNGYKIANPTVLSRIPREELARFLEGCGHHATFVEGDDPRAMHEQMARALDSALDEIAAIQQRARAGGTGGRPSWPAIVLVTPKGWTGPKEVDGHAVEGTWRAHQVPLAQVRENPAHLAVLEEWLRGYRPEELFTESGAPRESVAALIPDGDRRMGASPHANGGRLLSALDLPDYRAHAVRVEAPGAAALESTAVLGRFLREVMERSAGRRNFRVLSPDELTSNRLGALLEVTDRAWEAELRPGDDHLAPGGRVMEILSEHTCQGWLEGYLLTGRHGLFATYEAFVHVVDSMFNQHAKWLDTSRRIEWRAPVASFNYLLSSHVWRQDHNGFSHQDPGFIDVALNKSPDVVRVYLPPDANCLLAVMDECLRSRDRVNVVVAGKQPALQYLSADEAARHCARGASVWEWASTEGGEAPEVVIACAGDVPTLEALAAVELLGRELPDLRVRLVNVVDLMRLLPESVHAHGLSEPAFDTLFTTDRPVIFAYHGYPWLIHRLTYRRRNHEGFHVHGFKERGTTTTPFDMVVLNELDRFHLAIAAIRRAGRPGPAGDRVVTRLERELASHRRHIVEHGEDRPEIRDWTWRRAN